ncbi:unnamed protein product [Lepeophtheirus salmonis]|uniref:(salmon louse) hypothetical protein n=1 Tax=Lepeophtheirus salmonis TaxID=72036 RepID=A0A7R8H7X8_LEPSM|nr:unnamed protein product [Lepeophtheirus salmonis]CAF2912302.1 unnamed protein product [Lepeophtheirus salmonis]
MLIVSSYFYPLLNHAVDINVTERISTEEEPSILKTPTINYNNSSYDENNQTRNDVPTKESISNVLSTTVNTTSVDGEEDKNVTEAPILSTTKYKSLYDFLTQDEEDKTFLVKNSYGLITSADIANKTEKDPFSFFAESNASPVSFYEPTNGVVVKELKREKNCCRYIFTKNNTFLCIPRKCK